ncbi:hypothetical protein D3C87_1327060 [compost metagenome]
MFGKKRLHLFLVRFADFGQFGKHLLGRQVTAGVFDVGRFIETGVLQASGEYLGTTEGLTCLVDLALHRGIADHHAAPDGLLPEQFFVDQGIQGGLAQLLVRLGIADAAQCAPLILQVLDEIALQAQLGDFLAIDPCHGRPIAAKRGGNP